MSKLTNRHNKQVIYLFHILFMSLDIMFELGLLISAAGGPGESMTSQNFISAAHFLF